jgi:hypothetical protein
MRAPTERDQCQRQLDAMVDGFMRDDIPAFRDACAWLRDFVDQKSSERGRVMCGSRWFTAQKMEAAREHGRMRALDQARQLQPKDSA